MVNNRIFKTLASLRLTAVLLALGIILIFVGTVAQADEGLYYAQTRYFKQWLVIGITLFNRHVPIILPGGYLIGTTLLVNLLAAHFSRFKMTAKKSGIYLTHLGIILLLLGQLTTDMFAHESQLRMNEGQTRGFSESLTGYELAFVTSADASQSDEVVIPASLLKPGADIAFPALPFTVHVKSHFLNSEPAFRAPMMQNGPPATTNGVATSFDFRERAETRSTDDKNIPTVEMELAGPGGSLGDWVVSGWTCDTPFVMSVGDHFAEQMGPQMAQDIVNQLVQPQAITVGGREFVFTLRPARTYNKFDMTLVKATHTVYPGTDIPKDFRSRVRIDNPQTGENREVEIYMNSPLRYSGLTFFQSQMDAGEATTAAGRAASTVLQVVHNPSWLTPYVGCILVGAGLTIQFLMHLVGFISKRRLA